MVSHTYLGLYTIVADQSKNKSSSRSSKKVTYLDPHHPDSYPSNSTFLIGVKKVALFVVKIFLTLCNVVYKFVSSSFEKRLKSSEKEVQTFLYPYYQKQVKILKDQLEKTIVTEHGNMSLERFANTKQADLFDPEKTEEEKTFARNLYKLCGSEGLIKNLNAGGGNTKDDIVNKIRPLLDKLIQSKPYQDWRKAPSKDLKSPQRQLMQWIEETTIQISQVPSEDLFENLGNSFIEDNVLNKFEKKLREEAVNIDYQKQADELKQGLQSTDKIPRTTTVNVHLGQPTDHQHVKNSHFDFESRAPSGTVGGAFAQQPDAKQQTLGEHVPTTLQNWAETIHSQQKNQQTFKQENQKTFETCLYKLCGPNGLIDQLTDQNAEKLIKNSIQPELMRLVQSDIYKDWAKNPSNAHQNASLTSSCFMEWITNAAKIIGIVPSKDSVEISARIQEIQMNNSATLKDLGKLLLTSDSQHFVKNKLSEKIEWSVAYPNGASYTLLGSLLPLEYKSIREGNFDAMISPYQLDEHAPVNFIFGPCPTGESFINANLEKRQREGNSYLLYHNLQGWNKGENYRSIALMRLEKEFPETMRLLMTPVNGKVWKMKGDWKEFSSPEEFLLKYAHYAITGKHEHSYQSFSDLKGVKGNAHRFVNKDLSQDNGFYVGKDTLTDEQFLNAFEATSFLMQSILRNNNNSWAIPGQKELSNKEKGQMTQLLAQSMLSFGSIVKMMDDTSKAQSALDDELDQLNSECRQACKQDIDRGIMLNTLNRLYFHILSGKPLTYKNLSLTVGYVLGRAKLVNRRSILEERLTPLVNTLFFLSDHTELLKGCLKDYKNSISSFEEKPVKEIAIDNLAQQALEASQRRKRVLQRVPKNSIQNPAIDEKSKIIEIDPEDDKLPYSSCCQRITSWAYSWFC